MEAQEESQKPVLPKDLFKNRFTWFCHEITRNFVCWLLLGFSLVMGLFMIKTGVDSRDYFCTILPWVAFISAAFCLDSIHSFTLFWITHLKSRYEFSSKLAQQVLEVKPGSDIEKWDLISNRSNDYFYLSSEWNTPYFFYDGQGAQDLFTETILKSYLNGKLDVTAATDEIESAKNYLRSLREEYEFELKEPLPELSLRSGLGRESKENGLFRIFQYLEVISPFIWMVLTIFYLLDSIVSLSRCFFLSIFCLCVCVLDFHRMIFGHFRELNVRHAVKFLAVIRKVQPKGSLDKWGEIARYMNEYLADEQVSKYSVDLCTAKQCLEFYQRHFEVVVYGRTTLLPPPWEYDELINIIELTQPYIDSEAGGVYDFVRTRKSFHFEIKVHTIESTLDFLKNMKNMLLFPSNTT